MMNHNTNHPSTRVTIKKVTELQNAGEPIHAPFACTSLIIKDKNQNVYHGRGMELTFGEGLSSLTYYPKGHTFQHLAPNKTKGLAYQAKYPILAITTPFSEFNTNGAMEGLNAVGLSMSLNMLPAHPLADISEDQYPYSVPFASFGEWVLANFSSVEELKKHISQDKVYFWSEDLGMLNGLKSPFHFAVYDKTGGSVVVEVKDGAIILYDNPTGVMTNGPEFPWHIENLNNYTFLSNIDVTTAELGGLKLRQPDSGVATFVVPSSSTSVGRFVKAFYYSCFANKVDDPDLQMVELAHIMNNFDRPKNITKVLNNGEDPNNVQKYMTEFSVWISLSDLNRGIIQIRTYDSLNYQKFTFDEFNEVSEMVSHKLN